MDSDSVTFRKYDPVPELLDINGLREFLYNNKINDERFDEIMAQAVQLRSRIKGLEEED